MATIPQPSNPYQPPPTDIVAIGVVSQPGGRPGGLIAICVIALILGGLGGLVSLLSLGAFAAQPQIQKAIAVKQKAGMSKELVKAQQALQEKSQAVSDRYWGVNVGITATNLLVAGCLFTGAILVLCLWPKGRSLLIGVFAVAVAFEIVRTILQITMQFDMMAATSDAMRHMFEASYPAKGANGAQTAEVAAMAARVAFYFGIAFSIAFGLAKIIFYIVGFRYLRRPNIRALFQKPAVD